LPEGKVDTDQHRRTAEALDQRRARGVLEFPLRLLRFDPLFWGYALQLAFGERREQHARQDKPEHQHQPKCHADAKGQSKQPALATTPEAVAAPHRR
jgi:hypothetical protein